jgi:hypothetical protein
LNVSKNIFEIVNSEHKEVETLPSFDAGQINRQHEKIRFFPEYQAYTTVGT